MEDVESNSNDDDLNLNYQWDMRTLVLIIFVLFFIGGVVVGYVWGGHNVQESWKRYLNITNEKDLQLIECHNIIKETPVQGIELDFNFTS